jgi:hypothetical protein
MGKQLREIAPKTINVCNEFSSREDLMKNYGLVKFFRLNENKHEAVTEETLALLEKHKDIATTIFKRLIDRRKKKQERVRLPVDLTASGVFPPPEGTRIKERLEELKRMVGFLQDVKRHTNDRKAQIIVRTLKEKRLIKMNTERGLN